MRVTGAATLAGSAGTVMAALGDPDLLLRAIPGCERLDPTGAGRCLLTVTTAIAAVSGTYTAEAAIVERRWPGRAHGPADDLAGGSAAGPGGGLADGLVVATISAAGNRGTARAEITMRLTPTGEVATRVSYDIDAAVAGAIAGIGQRMQASIATRLAAEFLAALGGLLGELAPAAEPPAAQPRADALADAPAAEPPRVAEPVVVEPRLVESMVAGPTVRRPADGAADRDQPRAGTRPAVRAGVVAGGAVGLAGIVIGAVLGRRNRAAGRDSR